MIPLVQKIAFPLFSIVLALGLGGCGSEDDSSEPPAAENAPTTARVLYSEVTPAMNDGGIAVTYTDVDKAETLGIEVLGDGRGDITRINRYYLANNTTGSSVTLTLNDSGLPESLMYSDGYEVRLSNMSATSVDVRVFDPAGAVFSGPHTYQGDFSEIIDAASGVSTRNLYSTRALSWSSACDWFPAGGCATLYYIASKSIDIAGCAAAGSAAAASGGLAVPLAYTVCGSTLVSIASDVAKEATGEKIFEATNLLSSDLATAGSCIYGLVDPKGQALDCIKGIGEQIYWVYDKATANSPSNVSVNFPNDCLTGAWSGLQSCASTDNQGRAYPVGEQSLSYQITQNEAVVSFPTQPALSLSSYDFNLPTSAKLTDNNDRGFALTGSVAVSENGVSTRLGITQTYYFRSCDAALTTMKLTQDITVNGQQYPTITTNCTSNVTK